MSVPITQHCTKEFKEQCEKDGAKNVALTYNGDIVAIVNGAEFFDNRKEEICTRTFGTFSQNHPMAERIMKQGDFLISGASMDFPKRIMWNDGLDKYRMTPKEINAIMVERNADAVYAFQVRNPLHNGHCLLLTDTRKQLMAKGYKNPILLLHPLGGWCKDDDVPLAPRMAQH
jgi:3'-phosphoadenosine 5'-phosphosulfate synthase